VCGVAPRAPPILHCIEACPDLLPALYRTPIRTSPYSFDFIVFPFNPQPSTWAVAGLVATIFRNNFGVLSHFLSFLRVMEEQC
jgi:hypothetical protein